MEASVEFKHPLFQLERNTKHNSWIFTRYPVNVSENGNFNRGRKSFQGSTMCLGTGFSPKKTMLLFPLFLFISLSLLINYS